MATSWTSVDDGGLAMAHDREMLEETADGAISYWIYSLCKPWVTLGSRQDPENVFVQGSTVPWTIRPTGGLAVLHGHDLTIGWAMPLKREQLRHLKDVYRTMTWPLVLALCDVRLTALSAGHASPTSIPPKTEEQDCFASAGKFDLVNHELEKVVGCSLRVTRFGALLQASIPISRPLVNPAEVILGAHNAPARPWYPQKEELATALAHRLEENGANRRF